MRAPFTFYGFTTLFALPLCLACGETSAGPTESAAGSESDPMTEPTSPTSTATLPTGVDTSPPPVGPGVDPPGSGGAVGEGGAPSGPPTQSGAAGGTGMSGGTGGASEPTPQDAMPMFTFFTTSEKGIRSLAPDPENGFGGDLGGLAGADEICAKLAKASNPTDNKVWRAFLSATDDGNGNPVHAIERIGTGPWHDFNGRLLAENVAGLLPGNDERPAGADRQLAEMFTDEYGAPVSPNTSVVDNHDMLTGSDGDGRLMGGLAETCQDWTSKTAEGNGKPQIGHAWPRSAQSGRNWLSEHSAGGCAPGIDTRPIKNNGTQTVGAGGGYGGFYCFAVAGAKP